MPMTGKPVTKRIVQKIRGAEVKMGHRAKAVHRRKDVQKQRNWEKETIPWRWRECLKTRRENFSTM